MSDALTIAEIHDHFAGEWILVENPKTNASLEVVSGVVRFHSPDRDAVYRKAIELRPKRFAFLYTGTMPEGTEIVL